MRAAPPDVRAAGASLACVCAALPCNKKCAVSAPVRHGEIHERTGADWARAELGGETLAPAVLPSESKTKQDEHLERRPRWGEIGEGDSRPLVGMVDGDGVDGEDRYVRVSNAGV